MYTHEVRNISADTLLYSVCMIKAVHCGNIYAYLFLSDELSEVGYLFWYLLELNRCLLSVCVYVCVSRFVCVFNQQTNALCAGRFAENRL